MLSWKKEKSSSKLDLKNLLSRQGTTLPIIFSLLLHRQGDIFKIVSDDFLMPLQKFITPWGKPIKIKIDENKPTLNLPSSLSIWTKKYWDENIFPRSIWKKTDQILSILGQVLLEVVYWPGSVYHIGKFDAKSRACRLKLSLKTGSLKQRQYEPQGAGN